MTIHAPAGLRAFVETALQVSDTYLCYPLEWRELKEESFTLEEGIRVDVGALSHRVPCYGFRIQEPDRPGRLDVERLRAEGVPPGPLYRKIKLGERVHLPDGRVIDGSCYRNQDRPGRTVTVLGDTRPVPEAVRLAQGADVLIHEATYREGLEELAENYGHSTSVQAARIAREAGVKRLLLTHISSRYTAADVSALEAEARQQFAATDVIRDGQTVVVDSMEVGYGNIQKKG